ncbi:hypothetical protein Bbelb_200690 [Branchiostoma belcheri]|nr:hypothetical protein Bbelb_200690 [Branchiostoma belcheri]
MSNPAAEKKTGTTGLVLQGHTQSSSLTPPPTHLYGGFPEGERDASQEPRVEHFIVDVEDDMWGAMRSVFPNCTRKRCAFHLTQAIFKKIQNLGLQPAYYEKGGACELVGKLMVLQFLPAQRINRAFEDLRHQMTHPTILDPIRTNNDLEGYHTRLNKKAQHSLGFYLLDKMVSMNRLTRRTNNDLEGYHTRLNKKAQHSLCFYLLAKMVSMNRITRYQRRPLQSKVFTRYHAGELNTAKRLRVRMWSTVLSIFTCCLNMKPNKVHPGDESEETMVREKAGKRVNPNVIQEASRQYKQLETENPGLLAELKEEAKINKKTTLEDLNKDEKEQEAQRLYRELCKTVKELHRCGWEDMRVFYSALSNNVTYLATKEKHFSYKEFLEGKVEVEDFQMLLRSVVEGIAEAGQERTEVSLVEETTADPKSGRHLVEETTADPKS